MNFLVWYNPLTWIGDMAETAFGVIIAGLNILLYFLSTFVYGLIIDLYNLFDMLSKSRILDADIIETLANRIGLVLGVVMLFMVIISAIQMILDPDKIEKEAGNIIKKVLLVIVMLGASSFAFRALYGVQNILLESNVVSKLLLPYNVDTENFGGVLSSELFGAFYYVNNDLYTIDEADNIIADGDVVECYNNTKDLKEGIRDNKEFGAGYQCLNATSEDLNIIKFNGLLLLIFGLVAAYFLLSYCISVGVRTIQLAFLEIISPMAIISYLSPKKDTMFEKWWKLYFSTYIDVFIRVILINFIVFLIATIFENDGGWAFWKTVEENGGASGDFFIKVMMIMALFTFAQKAPTLIKNLFPGSDSGIGFGFNSGAAGILGMGAALAANIAGRGASTIAKTGGALGWDPNKNFGENLSLLKNKENRKNTLKALGAGVGGIALGVVPSLFRGGKAGFTSKNPTSAITNTVSAQGKANASYNRRVSSGVGLLDELRDNVSRTLGIDDTYAAVDKELNEISSVTDAVDNSPSVKKLKEMRSQKYTNATTIEQNAEVEYNVKSEQIKSNIASNDKEITNYKNKLDTLSKAETTSMSKEKKAKHKKDIATFEKKLQALEVNKNNFEKQLALVKIERDAKLNTAIELKEKAGNDLKAAQEATFALSMGNIEQLEQMAKDGLISAKIVTNSSGQLDIENTKISVSGVSISPQGTVEVATKHAHKVNSKTIGFKTYKEFDDAKVKLTTEKARVEQRKNNK